MYAQLEYLETLIASKISKKDVNTNKYITQAVCKNATNPLADKLMTALSKGRICRVSWITNEGKYREVARCKLWTKSGITFWPFVQANPVIHKGKYITCEDLDKKWCTGDTEGWVNINVERIVSVKVNGVWEMIFGSL